MDFNPNAPKVTVRQITDAAVPPIPDRAAVKAWIDSDGDGPRPLDANAGHYQHLVLNTVTGEFYFHCSDWRINRKQEEPGYYPGSLFPPRHWQGLPERLYWVIDSGVDERPYLTAQEGNAFAHEVAPLAQTLLSELLPVPGTDDLDWSAEAASAGLDIGRVCRRYRLTPEGRRPWLINIGEAIHPFPELIRPAMADASDELLDNEAVRLSRMGLHPHGHYPNLAEYYEIAQADADRFHSGLLGTRAYLYAHRAEQAAGRRASTESVSGSRR
jgi:hypothetical protein